VTAVAFSPDGERICCSCVDLTVRVYTTDAALAGKGAQATLKCVGDFVTACDFSYDGAEVVCAIDQSRKLRRYTINGSQLTQAFESKGALLKYPVKWLHASKGKWVSVMSEEDETNIKFYDYQGSLLKDIDTKQVKCFVLAAGGPFVGCASWSPGVKLLEVKGVRAEKKSAPTAWGGVEQAMSLRSEKGLTALGVSLCGTRAVTAQKDGKLVVWNLDVRYQVNEDPKVLVEKEFPGTSWSSVAITADLRGVIGCAAGGLQYLDLATLATIDEVEGAHRATVFTAVPHPSQSVVLTAARDATPRLWRFPAA